MKPSHIKEKASEIKKQKPSVRARDLAAEIGVSEAELLAAQVGSIATRLKNDVEAILTEVENLGEVMALTRNEACVHERKGVYAEPKFFKMGKMNTGMYLNPDIDLRLFLDHWTFSFAVSEDTKTGLRHSLQFFDKEGTAIHKIYLTNHSKRSAFLALVEKFKSDDQSGHLSTKPYASKDEELPDSEVDWKGLRSAWEEMKDIHEFFPLLKKFKVGREQSFRNIGSNFAYEVELDSARRALNLARDKNCDIMIFVGNRGCIQIHTGPVKKLMEMENWYNVLDPKFNLHLDEEKIHRIWVTRKPSSHGHVTAVEIFDKNSEIIATLFGQRNQKEPEQDLWREIIAELSLTEVSNVA